jgi:hypothetical protein
MCNLYSMTRKVDAIRRLFKVDPQYDRTGKLDRLPTRQDAAFERSGRSATA